MIKLNDRFSVGPSITYWNRGEPDARSDATDAMVVPLQARVRDPLWFLTRQWQLGEFLGADAGSPAYLTLSEQRGRLTAWSAPRQASSPLTAAPLEYQCERESLSPDLATRVELGQVFERLLTERGKTGLIRAFRTAYPVSDVATDPSDVSEVSFRLIVGGRALDGMAFATAARASQPNLPTNPSVSAGDQSDVLEAVADFLPWVTQTLGLPAVTDPVAWVPEQLAYELNVSATTPDGSAVTLVATPGSDGLLDWSAFDLQALASTASAPPTRGAPNTVSPSRAVIPTHVRFRGMPNARFWDFESAGTDLASVIPDKRDLARLAVMDFALAHAHDWFVIPIDMAPGEMYQVKQLAVHDVFGVTTIVPRADRQPNAAGQWSLFTTSIVGQPVGTTADFFLFPSSAGSAMQVGAVLEQVHFARDEMANMVWAVEQLTENALGQPWPGSERDVARNVPAPGATQPPPTVLPGVSLRYQIQSRLPEHWIPFLPHSINPAAGTVALERGAMLRDDGTPIQPAGRILRPTSIPGGSPYRMREEEVARTGVRVQRVICRSRWSDGSTTVWTMRRRGPGAGESSSGIRFDTALDVTT
jgi:hypothetical protein